jgi:hypothetical protein
MFYWLYVQGFKVMRVVREVFCPIRHYVKPKMIEYPWLWIGSIEHEDFITTVTDLVNARVYPGCIVDHEFLRQATGINTSYWRYLDAITLKEIEFPEEGITIADDSNE